jgi:hypothetical protein
MLGDFSTGAQDSTKRRAEDGAWIKLSASGKKAAEP